MTFHEWIRKTNKTTIDHYKNLRRALGLIGIFLPIVLFIFGPFAPPDYAVQISISHFYHTGLRDILVGALAAASLFLITYTGYGIIDNLASLLIGLAGLGVVIFPCGANSPFIKSDALVGILSLPQDVSAKAHIACALVFFVFLGLNSLILFTVTDPDTWNPKKKIRNVIFIICGGGILACLFVLIIIWAAARDFFSTTHVGLVGEWIMLTFFGVSWLVKGEPCFLRDKSQKSVKAA